MVEPRTIVPLSSIVHHHYLASPLAKKKVGRPLGSKNKPKLSHVISQANVQVQKPIYIEVPNNLDVIEAMVQFAHHHKVSITVLSASGTIASVTLNYTDSYASTFTLYGPFSLISLTGTYINNTAISSSSSSCQSIIGFVRGKLVAANGVIVMATIVNNLEVHKDVINNNSKEWDDDNNNPNTYI
ncbi:hypothetical protein JHK82_055279 [Glycine max]|nr:hypothetical protein JHK86_055116 [Glycine max]KAG4917805.1 hypothetical protein JHK85_056086 [Glycine max]KAG5073906.1 hypothetical protein JHK84_055137 [Glycine max]KAG5076584.1 hypothetical protein JHK82_055279 [Glycine max]